jgi:hypothetical protein
MEMSLDRLQKTENTEGICCRISDEDAFSEAFAQIGGAECLITELVGRYGHLAYGRKLISALYHLSQAEKELEDLF